MKNKIISHGISPTKGHHPREAVLPVVHGYTDVMGVILKAVKARHKEHAKALRTALLYTADAVFQQHKERLERFRPAPEASLQQKIQFNDSVSRLRTLHNIVRERINEIGRFKEGFNEFQA